MTTQQYHFFFSDDRKTVTFIDPTSKDNKDDIKLETNISLLDNNVSKLVIKTILNGSMTDIDPIFEAVEELKELELIGGVNDTSTVVLECLPAYCSNLEKLTILNCELFGKGIHKLGFLIGGLSKLTTLKIYNEDPKSFIDAGALSYLLRNISQSNFQLETLELDCRNLFCGNSVIDFLWNGAPLAYMLLVKVKNLVMRNLIVDSEKAKGLFQVAVNNKELEMIEFPDLELIHPFNYMAIHDIIKKHNLFYTMFRASMCGLMNNEIVRMMELVDKYHECIRMNG